MYFIVDGSEAFSIIFGHIFLGMPLVTAVERLNPSSGTPTLVQVHNNKYFVQNLSLVPSVLSLQPDYTAVLN